ncbi:hypothetical protein V8E53_003754 [Lactarius tabidus]
MPWESIVLDIFRAVPENPSRYDFHAPYNKLLFCVFPMEDRYTVAPNWNASSSQLSYFRFDIFYKKIPVLILELKGPGDLQYPSKRQESVQQIQRRLKELRPECTLPELHAISVFGTKLCFCKLDDRDQSMQPSFMDAHPEGTTTDLTPEQYWDCDIMEEEGEKRFKAVVEEIKRGCAAL